MGCKNADIGYSPRSSTGTSAHCPPLIMDGDRSKSGWRGKLFKSTSEKDKQSRFDQDDVNDFLRPSSSKSTSPPQLGKLDTSAARRWPTASDINASGAFSSDSASVRCA